MIDSLVEDGMDMVVDIREYNVLEPCSRYSRYGNAISVLVQELTDGLLEYLNSFHPSSGTILVFTFAT